MRSVTRSSARWLFALLVVPGLAYVAYRRPRRVFHNPVLGLDRGGLSQTPCAGSLRRPGIAYLLSAGAAIAVVVLGVTVWREFLPDLDEGSIWLHAEMPPGISLQKATDMVADLRRALERISGSVLRSSATSAATTTAPIRGRRRTWKRP